jgi:hypothetical protein
MAQDSSLSRRESLPPQQAFQEVMQTKVRLNREHMARLATTSSGSDQKDEPADVLRRLGKV